MKKLLVAVLVFTFVFLQIRLWVGEGSIAHVVSLRREIEKQKIENAQLRSVNDQLAAEVRALKDGDSGIEARARQDMGFVKEGETFFMFIEADKSNSTKKKP